MSKHNLDIKYIPNNNKKLQKNGSDDISVDILDITSDIDNINNIDKNNFNDYIKNVFKKIIDILYNYYNENKIKLIQINFRELKYVKLKYNNKNYNFISELMIEFYNKNNKPFNYSKIEQEYKKLVSDKIPTKKGNLCTKCKFPFNYIHNDKKPNKICFICRIINSINNKIMIIKNLEIQSKKKTEFDNFVIKIFNVIKNNTNRDIYLNKLKEYYNEIS